MAAECDPSVLWKKKAFVSVAVLLAVRLIAVHFPQSLDIMLSRSSILNR